MHCVWENWPCHPANLLCHRKCQNALVVRLIELYYRRLETIVPNSYVWWLYETYIKISKHMEIDWNIEISLNYFRRFCWKYSFRTHWPRTNCYHQENIQTHCHHWLSRDFRHEIESLGYAMYWAHTQPISGHSRSRRPIIFMRCIDLLLCAGHVLKFAIIYVARLPCQFRLPTRTKQNLPNKLPCGDPVLCILRLATLQF